MSKISQKNNSMKGVILAGGTGSRLYPLTKVTNKHLLPIYDKPMIYYPITTLRNSGINDIMIVTGKESAGDFMELLGSGSEIGVNLTFRLQEGAGGIADALRLCEDFTNGGNIAVILGDNIFEDYFTKELEEFKDGAIAFVKKVDNPRRFGVVEFDRDYNVLSIEEKPKSPKSNYVQTGFYVYDNNVFDYIRMLKPSERGELEITDVNNLYLDRGKIRINIIDGIWQDAGTFESWYESNVYARNKGGKDINESSE